MKSVYLSAFLLFCLCPAANAQLPDQLPLDSQMDSITQELDDVIEEVQESVTQEVDAVVDQLDNVTQEVDSVADSLGGLESGLDDVMGNSLEGVEDVVGGGVEGIVEELGEVDDRVEDQLRNQDLLPGTRLDEALTKPVADTLALLPDSLGDVVPIVDREGKTVFVEVKVEQDWYAVEREWLLVVDNKSRVDLTAVDADIIEQRKFSDLGLRLIRFRVPAELDSLDALKKRLPAHLHDQLDRNHIYIPQLKKPEQTSRPPLTSSACDAKVKIGMIDTAINAEHPAFAKSRITSKDFAGEKFNAPRAHGTAVAGLLVGRGEQLKPLLPAAKLYSASVFHPRSENAQGASMMNLVRALNWLAAENVRVINMSLAGPDNKILAVVINKLISSGTTIIAAAGNEGPAALPVYPAAYENVIAVTAVDDQQRSYRWANRGSYIDFAALGVGVLTARAGGDFGSESGTSMAAPVVSALVACEFAKQKSHSHPLTPEQLALNKLIGRAIDLGDKGRDPVFGYGLLNTSLLEAND